MRIRVIVAPSKGGLGLDVSVVEEALRRARLTHMPKEKLEFEQVDPFTFGTEAMTTTDVNIHFEIPCRLAMPWARYNVCVVNAEWFQLDTWDWSLEEPKAGGMDLFIFKSGHVPALFPGLSTKRYMVCPWRSPLTTDFGKWSQKESRFLYLLGTSVSKHAAAYDIVAGWQPGWPPLELWCSPSFAESVRETVIDGADVILQTEYRSAEEKTVRQRACKWHVVASEAEGFGLAMAEAVSCGVPIVWSGLPVFDWSWQLTTGRLALTELPRTEYRDPRYRFTADALEIAVTSVLSLTDDDIAGLQLHYKKRLQDMKEEFNGVWARVLKRSMKEGVGPRIPRPLGKGAQPPKVAVITVTRNRTAWWPNMVQNFVTQAWPMSHLEWVIVDDGDEDQRLESRVAKLLEDRPGLTVRYISLPPGQSIGAKRNAGVSAAGTDVSLFMMMDDDDHYPGSSVATRASWLSVPGVNIAYCSTLYMYDIQRYISAINTPPLKDSPATRVSEATLTFNRAAFAERVFPDMSMAEGEDFMEGRWADSIEIPPHGVIVSFIHKGNTSSRRIPTEEEPNGSHYGFSDDYFRWLFSVGA